jgi:hypothetical protein
MLKHNKKEVWVKPEVQAMNISRDTFGGTGMGAEKAGKGGPPKKKGSRVV